MKQKSLIRTVVPERPHPNPSPKGEGLKQVFFPLSFRRGGQGVRSQGMALLVFLLSTFPAGAAVDPFYQSLLRDGQHAFDRKDYAAATRDLRLACFGMLDEPRLLADCLVRLALAQDRANDVMGFQESFQRLVEIEDRFKAYSQGGLAPDLRAALEARLPARIPAATLAGAPAFRSTVATRKPEPVPATASPPRDRKGGKEPAGPVETPAAGSSQIQVAPAGAKPLSAAELDKLEQARRLLSEQHPLKELRQAFDLAREVADAHPEFREAQHLAGEGAYRISRWSDATVYFRRGGDPGEDKPERLFYLAVCLYESGNAVGAAAALRRALPNLQRTPYVDSYAKKILGQ
jgi:hypothetical protein